MATVDLRAQRAQEHISSARLLAERGSLECATFQFCLALEASVQFAAAHLVDRSGPSGRGNQTSGQIIQQLYPKFDVEIVRALRRLNEWRNRAVHRYSDPPGDRRWWESDRPEVRAALFEDLSERLETLAALFEAFLMEAEGA